MTEHEHSQGGTTYADARERYRLDDRVATGGMGEAWRATDTVLGGPVAVKLLTQEHADDNSGQGSGNGRSLGHGHGKHREGNQ